MKPKFAALWIGLILAAVVTILLIVLPKLANLYAAYVFCLIGIAMIIAGVWATDDNAPASYALLGQVGWFLPISLFISVVVLVLQNVGVIALPVLWHCIVQIIPLTLAGIHVIAVYTGKQEIECVDKQVEAQKARFTAMINTATVLHQKVYMWPEEQRVAAEKALTQVIEELRYSDPMRNVNVAEMDQQIVEKICTLQSTCNTDNAHDFIAHCESICAEIQYRNGILKSSKT